jgi:hypothetical protein
MPTFDRNGLADYPVPASVDSTGNDMTEARKIYFAIFRRAIPPIVAERFAAANERLERAAGPRELAEHRRIVAECADLEAAEVAGRYTGRLKLLTRKFRLMVYLAETLPENQPFFVNETSSFLTGLWQGFAGGVRTIFKLLKGVWLLRGVARG